MCRSRDAGAMVWTLCSDWISHDDLQTMKINSTVIVNNEKFPYRNLSFILLISVDICWSPTESASTKPHRKRTENAPKDESCCFASWINEVAWLGRRKLHQIMGWWICIYMANGQNAVSQGIRKMVVYYGARTKRFTCGMTSPHVRGNVVELQNVWEKH